MNTCLGKSRSTQFIGAGLQQSDTPTSREFGQTERPTTSVPGTRTDSELTPRPTEQSVIRETSVRPTEYRWTDRRQRVKEECNWTPRATQSNPMHGPTTYSDATTGRAF